MTTAAPPPTYPVVYQACEQWKRKLIDLSRNNRLLFFRDSKLSYLLLPRLDDHLVSKLLSETTIRLSVLLAETDATKQFSIARGIGRKAIENFEERGLETLYITLGIAAWPASDKGRHYAAPVILLPVKLESDARSDASARITITGEPQLNTVLLHVLTSDFGIQIEAQEVVDPSDTDNAWSMTSVFAQIQKLAGAIAGFEIAPTAYLGNFSFQKQTMVQDFEDHPNVFAAHPIVAALAGDSAAQQLVRPDAAPTDHRLLDHLPVEQEYLILDADSSQQSVLQDVLAGRNLVIQGPPGTGKSQTIANIIAACIAQGKRVLFVAEKRAALDVVAQRLQDSNLGHMLLDIHNAESSRKQFVQRMAETLQAVRTVPEVPTEQLHAQLADYRRELNAYVASQHRPLPQYGLSAFEVRGKLLHLQRAAISSQVRWTAGALQHMTSAVIAEIARSLQEASDDAALFFGTSASSWNGVNRPIHNVTGLTTALSWLQANMTFLQAHLHADCDALGISAPRSIDELATLREMMARIGRLHERYYSSLWDQDLEAWYATCAPALRSRVAASWESATQPAIRATVKRMGALRRVPRIGHWNLLMDLVAARHILHEWQQRTHGASPPTVFPWLVNDGEATKRLQHSLISLQTVLNRTDLLHLPLSELETLVGALLDDVSTLLRLQRLDQLTQEIERQGAGAILAEIQHRRSPPEHWVQQLQYAWYNSVLLDAQSAEPTLLRDGKQQDRHVHAFRAADDEHIRTNAGRIARRHAEQVIATRNAYPDQDTLVRRESEKKRKHLSLRKLLAQAPDLMTALFPCWMASPLSVSQLIDTNRPYFDVVIFDEASQILPEDAIPSLVRGKQVVVAGDKFQLPPTTFFAESIEDAAQDEEADATVGFESFLDLMSATFGPDRYLEWHYRSRDEALIAFSNHYIYHNRLLTFPGVEQTPAITFIQIPWEVGHDVQAESASAEVRRVVDLMIEHARRHPHQSLGVIALGITHARRIQAQLDERLRRDTAIDDSFFDPAQSERCFIKSIEQVQGDERDAIILSVGRAKDRTGRLAHTFGPINQEGGERRLNVAVTRARQRMTVVASFSHEDIDLTRTASKGVEFLRNYLAYAASGGQRLGERIEQTVPLNPFEEDVRVALSARGLHLAPQLGVGQYRIDFAVQHPDIPGRFLLAIECDGASYHSSPTARDRDRLRQQQLEGLGWQFLRIWSTDWFTRRSAEIERIVQVYTAALAHQATERPKPVAADPPPSPQLTVMKPGMAPKRGPRPVLLKRTHIDLYSQAEIISVIAWVTSDSKLRTDDEIIDETWQTLGFQRRGPRIVATINAALLAMRQSRRA